MTIAASDNLQTQGQTEVVTLELPPVGHVYKIHVILYNGGIRLSNVSVMHYCV